MNRWWQISIGVISASVFPLAAANTFDVQAIPKQVETSSFTAELTEVFPWCDHMPSPPPVERRQYLSAQLTLRNQTDQPLLLSITQVAISFDEQDLGRVVTELSARGKDGRGTGQTTITIPPLREQMVIELRGDNLYDEGHHGQQLYLTLPLSSQGEQLIVRHSGPVLETS